MMEIRILDGKPFIASRNGKRETVQTLADFSATAHQRIEKAAQCIATLRQSEASAHVRLESIVLAGTDTATSRAELVAIRDEIAGHERDSIEARTSIDEAASLIDAHTTTAIRESGKRRLADLLNPFEQALKEIHQ